jgi:hypothetical protein
MKASKATMRDRTEDVLRILLDGARPWDVRAYIAEQEVKGQAPWTIQEGNRPLSERQVRRYVAAAERLIDESVRQNRKRRIRRHIAQRESLYARCVTKGDERTALAVLRDLAELQDLYPPKKSDMALDLTPPPIEFIEIRQSDRHDLDDAAEAGPRPDDN